MCESKTLFFRETFQEKMLEIDRFYGIVYGIFEIRPAL